MTVISPKPHMAQSAGAAEYTNCISAEGYDPLLNKSLGYDTKQSDGEAPVMGMTLNNLMVRLQLLELWEMWSTPLLPLFPSPLGPRVIAPDRV